MKDDPFPGVSRSGPIRGQGSRNRRRGFRLLANRARRPCVHVATGSRKTSSTSRRATPPKASPTWLICAPRSASTNGTSTRCRMAPTLLQVLRDRPGGIRSVVLDSVLPRRRQHRRIRLGLGGAQLRGDLRRVRGRPGVQPGLSRRARAEFTRMVNELSASPIRVTVDAGGTPTRRRHRRVQTRQRRGGGGRSNTRPIGPHSGHDRLCTEASDRRGPEHHGGDAAEHPRPRGDVQRALPRISSARNPDKAAAVESRRYPISPDAVLKLPRTGADAVQRLRTVVLATAAPSWVFRAGPQRRADPARQRQLRLRDAAAVGRGSGPDVALAAAAYVFRAQVTKSR